MARPQKDRLRPLPPHERTTLEQVARAAPERADRVARAKARLAVAGGAAFTEAARTVGRRAGDAVAKLAARFTAAGLAALTPRHGGAPPTHYGPAAAERLVRAARRPPARALDGTATWSLTTLQQAVRAAPAGLPQVSTCTILRVLHDAGFTWPAERTWCETGVVQRTRQSGVVAAIDPDAVTNRG